MFSSKVALKVDYKSAPRSSHYMKKEIYVHYTDIAWNENLLLHILLKT